ncbi:MAG TPA: Rrf2 family transcriptional regulator [Vicinamibacterales bacterium]|nr:Rrf2 family transcriptional regulator [Vicinamibacterales bacterium]
MTSGRFGIALHALALLARRPEGCSSGELARSINVHPVVLRRVLADIRRAGLVQAREGRRGGYRLRRSPGTVTLADVYRIVEREGPLAPNQAEPDPECPVGSGVRAAFRHVAAAGRIALLRALERTTIDQFAADAVRAGRLRRT